MSEASVSTTSSRIKQFGLYRTIDARTEEFLRLSRKRQLRQGCACAAVSTAITVIIVVSIILIYEYGIISEFSPKSTIRPNWLGLMNTSEALPFEAKFNKASIHLESSIPLLPLVLKALKKNRYYEHIMEDFSSPNPLYKNKDTDDLLTKNFFSDTRNWMRIPTSRIYAIEYKTSPIVYYKSPTRNTDYFTKIRRIRDYQRIMNYVDKMISEKITGSTMPMLKSSYAFDKNLPIPYTTPMPSMNYKTRHNLKSISKQIIPIKKAKCSCPKKMNKLLNKIVTILQKLLPNVTQDISDMPKPCDHNHKHITDNVTESSPTTVKNHITPEVLLKSVENSNPLLESKNTLKETLPNPEGKLKEPASLLTVLPSKVDFTLQTIIKLIRPKKNREKDMINDFRLHRSKTIKTSPESTEDYYFSPEDTTKPIKILKTTSNESPEPVPTKVSIKNVKENFLTKKDLNVTSTTKTTFPTFYEEADENYLAISTTPKIKNNFESLDVHSLELVKSKLIPNKIEPSTKGEGISNKVKPNLLYHSNTKKFQNNSLILDLLRKMGQIIKSKSITTEKNTEEPFDNITHPDVKKSTQYQNGEYFHYDDSEPPSFQTIQNFTTTPLYTTEENYFNKNEQDVTFKSEDITLEDEDEKTSYEEALTSNNLKRIEKLINLFNNSAIEAHNTNIKQPSYQWESLRAEEYNAVEDTTKYNISKSRSSYLEIQRNEWKHDDHESRDYDNVVLLIYENMITVETYLVQNKRPLKSNHTQNDLPVADRLDRSRFGFDQDYYEKMPLLVNSLQEVNYVDPSIDTTISSLKPNKKTKSIYIRPKTVANVHKFIRRTSPKPFVFEYRSPYPKPFSKFNGIPKNWVEKYRNAERLKNLHDVIKYLEKTLHAKFGDMYLPSKSQIAFSGVLISPMNTEDVASHSIQNEETPQDSRKVEVKTNHQSDRLYTYRPDNPGDVNLLADGFRFSPTIFSTTNRKKSKYSIPMLRSLPEMSNKCIDIECDRNNDSNIDKKIYLPNSVLIKSTSLTQNTKPKSLNVMLNFHPLQATDKNKNDNEEGKFYITTSKPLFQYKRKMAYPVRRTYLKNDRPTFMIGKRKNDHDTVTKKYETLSKELFRFNVYSKPNREEPDVPKTTERSSTSTASTSTKPDEEIKFAADDYLVPNFSSVEDYHIGSSGIIPIELRLTPATYPIVTPIIPLTSTVTTTETVYTNQPEIFKFSREDAKIPDQYINIQKPDRSKLEDLQNENHNSEFSKSENDEVIRKTLLIKLRNMAETTTEEVSSDISNVEITTDVEMGITTGTYVPQINGHYRNMRHKTVTSLLQENSERYRKKRLENLLTTPKSTYVPMHDIRRMRNNTNV